MLEQDHDTMSQRTKPKHFQEPLFPELRCTVCYVCYQRIKGDEGVHIGHQLWRHKKCKPGSVQWLKSPKAREIREKNLAKKDD